MRKAKIVSSLVLGSAMTLMTAVPAQALVVQQSQEMNTSSNARVEMTAGTGTAEASSNASGKQGQYVETGSAMIYQTPSYVTPTYTYAAPSYQAPVYVSSRSYNVPVVMVTNADGNVRINWDMRGGTCHVRYTEASERVYKYETAAGCDDGGVTVGGLTPGVRYRFQVRQNNGGWSRAVVVKAW